MTGIEMRAIRDELGLSAVQLGRAFGYAGGDATVATMISKYETGMRQIPIYLQRLLLMFRRHGVPPLWPLGSAPRDDEPEYPGDDK